MVDIIRDTFLSIVRLGIGHPTETISEIIDWKAINDLAAKQGLSAIVVDGIERLPDAKRPPKSHLLEWIGDVLQNYESRYIAYEKSLAELAAFYNEHGFKMMVLKGYACALNWPKPEHRPCGDIDIWMFGQQKDADETVCKELGIKIDFSHHHHTVFQWRDFMVENHYDFVNIYDYKSSKELEFVLKELGADSNNSTVVFCEKVYLPSPNLHALFLLRHMVSHFASTRISLRQILDWGFFVEKQNSKIDWHWLLNLLSKYHMLEFFNCINAICIEDLGFNKGLFPTAAVTPDLKDRVLNDIFNPKFVGEEPSEFFSRLWYKYRRWKGNWWKQDICYDESRWTGFWRGIWYHLLKPSSL